MTAAPLLWPGRMADKAAKAESRMIFEVLKPATGERITARLGRLVVSGRQVTQTPNFLGVATRGAVPHLTPDNVSQYKPFQGVYLALEDCEWPGCSVHCAGARLTEGQS